MLNSFELENLLRRAKQLDRTLTLFSWTKQIFLS